MSNNAITVATANTYESRMLQHNDGLLPFVESGVDVLLLQEVLGMNEATTRARLMQDGYVLVQYAGELGLATALHQDFADKAVITHAKQVSIHQPSTTEVLMKRLQPHSHRLRPRGMLVLGLAASDTQPNLFIANTHPIIFARAVARHKQVRAIQAALSSPIYDGSRLILAGDMNHYPAPHTVDRRMHQALRLQMAKLDRSTWPVQGTKHEWMARIGSLVTHSIDAFDANLDAMLYRGVTELDTRVVDIHSDHRAVVTTFDIP